MKQTMEGTLPMNDYFADRLLGALDTSDPVYAAYEAQAVSREVDFDFADFQAVVPRALDEIRETKEAFAEEGSDGREHFGDEIADIMFSLVNLGRHAGLDAYALPTVAALAEDVAPTDAEIDTVALIDGIGSQIQVAAEVERTVDEKAFMQTIQVLFASGMRDAITIARVNGFDPEVLLRENVRKYLVRCQAIEQLASEDDKQWADLAKNGEIITYWKRAKTLLK